MPENHEYETIPLTTFTLVSPALDYTKYKNVFRIELTPMSILLRAGSTEDMELWLKAIRESIKLK